MPEPASESPCSRTCPSSSSPRVSSVCQHISPSPADLPSPSSSPLQPSPCQSVSAAATQSPSAASSSATTSCRPLASPAACTSQHSSVAVAPSASSSTPACQSSSASVPVSPSLACQSSCSTCSSAHSLAASGSEESSRPGLAQPSDPHGTSRSGPDPAPRTAHAASGPGSLGVPWTGSMDTEHANVVRSPTSSRPNPSLSPSAPAPAMQPAPSPPPPSSAPSSPPRVRTATAPRDAVARLLDMPTFSCCLLYTSPSPRD